MASCQCSCAPCTLDAVCYSGMCVIGLCSRTLVIENVRSFENRDGNDGGMISICYKAQYI